MIFRPAQDGRIFVPHWSGGVSVIDRKGRTRTYFAVNSPIELRPNGVAFMPEAQAAAFARRCNDYAAELIAKHPRRFGCFGLLPMHDIDTAIEEARYCLETLRFDGMRVSLAPEVHSRAQRTVPRRRPLHRHCARLSVAGPWRVPSSEPSA